VTAWPFARAALTQRAPVPREAPRTRIFMQAVYVRHLGSASYREGGDAGLPLN
jgi:hypothetical protein